MATTPRGYPYPAAADANDVPADLQALAQKNDDRPGISPLTTAARDALAGTDLWDGRVIYNLTTSRLERYNAAVPAWQSAGISDHGDLTGLADDDHPQYLLKTDNLLALTDKAAARENLGANAAYAPKSETTRETIGAGHMEPLRGAPSLSNPTGTWVMWLLDAATVEGVGSAVGIPPGWQTVDVDLWWVNAGTGSGNVTFLLMRQNAVEGLSLGTDAAAAAVTATAAGQNIVQRTTLETGLAVGDTSRLLSLGVERRAAAASDTLANDVGVLALVLKKVS
jgi:hypothetical protein